jgi:hypothetical protein
MIVRWLKIAWDTAKLIPGFAAENQKLRRKVKGLQKTLMLMQRQRDHWVAYQQQTALEAMAAQEIMVNEIDTLRRKLGAAPESKWIEAVEKFSKVRGEKTTSPFSTNFDDLVESGTISDPDSELLIPLDPKI